MPEPLKLTNEQILASELHERMCYSRNTEFCGWYWMDHPWQQAPEGRHSKEYLARAKRLLALVDGDIVRARAILRALWY